MMAERVEQRADGGALAIVNAAMQLEQGHRFRRRKHIHVERDAQGAVAAIASGEQGRHSGLWRHPAIDRLGRKAGRHVIDDPQAAWASRHRQPECGADGFRCTSFDRQSERRSDCGELPVAFDRPIPLRRGR